MSSRSPYEKFNVFDQSVQNELRKRRLSTNLVEVRAPFIRYTTTVEFPDAAWYANLPTRGEGALNLLNYIQPMNLNRYLGCKFFTLGIHGWDKSLYNDDDIYNMQKNRGAVVGITYKQGKQILVRTSNDTASNTNDPERFESPKGYPPPGIESATVERLRNGNVMKFTVNIVCYTQQQLQMLDMLSFSPGMTCVLEWGNIISGPNGFDNKGLKADAILDFKNVTQTENELSRLLNLHKGGIRRSGVSKGARTEFIEKYCEPNNYNYDFAIAHVANVKTRVQNNKYKVSVTAYGVADNIMYISAYATNNPDFAKESNKGQLESIITSVREYFIPGNKFSVLLDKLVAGEPPTIPPDPEIVKFDEPDDVDYANGPSAAAGSGTKINDLGQEQTFYITLNKFIRFFLNDPVNGIAKIINDAVKITDTMDPVNNVNDSIQILEDLSDSVDGDLKVGYNVELRSTDPSTMLISNNLKTIENTTTLGIILGRIRTTVKGQTRTTAALSRITANPLNKINSQGQPAYDGTPSGIASSTSGIWLNSKMIQSVFMEARTIHEAIESILNRMNAATEGYWDLALTYDEEQNNFRIVDNNLKIIPDQGSETIYTFNKRLPTGTSAADNITGPEVLDIQVNADYPKLLASQLAISALTKSSGIPNRTDLQYARNPLLGPRLNDLLRKDEKVTQEEQKPDDSKSQQKGVGLNKFIEEALKGALYDIDGSRDTIGNNFRNATLETLSTGTRQALYTIFTIHRPLTLTESQSFLSQIDVSKLSDESVNAIREALIQRSRAIIIRAKDNEFKVFDSGVAGALLGKASAGSGVDISAQLDQIKKNITTSKNELLSYIGSRSTTIGRTRDVQAETAERERRQRQTIDPQGNVIIR